MKSFKKIMVAAATTALFAQAQAASTTADIDAYAGLAPVLTVSCTPVKFGVWRMPVRSTGGTTIITLPYATGVAAATGNTTSVALASTAAWQPARGLCTVGGSQSADATNVTITGLPSATISMVSDATSPFTGLAAPSTAITGMSAVLSGPSTAALSGGGATFYVGGVLTVPQTITASNYGAYKSTAATTLTVTDVGS